MLVMLLPPLLLLDMLLPQLLPMLELQFMEESNEPLGDLEGLGQEPLDLPRPRDLDLVLLRQLVHTQDSNDILKRLVILEQLLNVTGNGVVLGSNDVGVHDTGGGIEGVDSGVDSTLGNTTGQDSGGVQVRKGGGGGRVSQVISGLVDGLDRCPC